MTKPRLIKRQPEPEAVRTPAPKTADATEAEKPAFNFGEAWARTRTAFVSISPGRRTPEAEAAIARRFPDWKLKYFDDFAGPETNWRKENRAHLAGLDAVIVVTDETRRIGSGSISELRNAKKLGKFLIVFNISTGRFERYCGWQPGEEGRGAILNRQRDREERAGLIAA